MDDTREGIEKQKVCLFCHIKKLYLIHFWFQEIDELIAGTLTAEDEEAVDLEFAEIIKESLPDVPTVDTAVVSDIDLPSVPSEEPSARKEKTKKEPQLLAA